MIDQTTKLSTGLLLDGRYQLREMIGEGGFAEVYEALDIKLGRRVAVKLLKSLPAGKDTGTAHERFFREARFAAQIAHPDVVTIYDFGTANDAPFIVLELLHGRSLSKHLWLHGHLEPERARQLFSRVLHALAEAHDMGVIHRDLKPSNLVLTNEGEPIEALRVLDFGIAFYYGESMTRLTSTGQFLGTPEYVSPEYVRDQQITPGLDVYQLGLIFVEMLVGKPLVNLEHPLQCLFAHCNGRVELPKYLADSPAGPILERAINPDVRVRYQNARAFLDAFDTIQPGDIPRLPDNQSVEEIVVTREWASDEIDSWSAAIPGLSLESGIPAPALESPLARPSTSRLYDTTKPGRTEEGTQRSLVVPILAAAALCVVGVGGVVAVGMSSSNEPVELASAKVAGPLDESTEPLDSKATEDEASSETAQQGGAVGSDASPVDDTAAEARPTVVSKITVTSVPPGAVVFSGSEPLGMTPLELKAPINAIPLSLTLEGYESADAVLEPDEPVLEVVLTAAPVVARKTSKKKSAKKKPAKSMKKASEDRASEPDPQPSSPSITDWDD